MATAGSMPPVSLGWMSNVGVLPQDMPPYEGFDLTPGYALVLFSETIGSLVDYTTDWMETAQSRLVIKVGQPVGDAVQLPGRECVCCPYMHANPRVHVMSICAAGRRPQKPQQSEAGQR
jgi:hypothetical protein